MCLLVALELLDFLELLLLLLRLLRSFLAFSCATNSLINDPLSTTTRASHIIFGNAGDLLRLGVAGGVQSCSASSKTHGNSSSSVMNELECASSSQLDPEFEDRDERRGHEG